LSAEFISLSQWKRQHEEEVANFKAQRERGVEMVITIDEIDQHMKELFQLPDIGKTLEETYKKVTEKDSLNYQEVYCSVPVCPKDGMNDDKVGGYLESAKKMGFEAFQFGYETFQSATRKTGLFATAKKSVTSWKFWKK
jgi:hypothetical protein